MLLVRWRAALAILLASTACGGPIEEAIEDPVAGVRVVLRTSAAFASAPDFQARLDGTIDVGLAYWGSTRRALDGKTIALVDEAHLQGCDSPTAIGCYDGKTLAVSTRDPSLGTFPCVEATALVHELGHAAIGDPYHRDPRWMQMDDVAQALAGRVGYTIDGTTDCTTYVSVWRHPLGTP